MAGVKETTQTKLSTVGEKILLGQDLLVRKGGEEKVVRS